MARLSNVVVAGPNWRDLRLIFVYDNRLGEGLLLAQPIHTIKSLGEISFPRSHLQLDRQVPEICKAEMTCMRHKLPMNGPEASRKRKLSTSLLEIASPTNVSAQDILNSTEGII